MQIFFFELTNSTGTDSPESRVQDPGSKWSGRGLKLAPDLWNIQMVRARIELAPVIHSHWPRRLLLVKCLNQLSVINLFFWLSRVLPPNKRVLQKLTSLPRQVPLATFLKNTHYIVNNAQQQSLAQVKRGKDECQVSNQLITVGENKSI